MSSNKISLLNLAAELGNVSRACKVMGFSRDTFYGYQAAVESGGVDALIDANRRKPNPKNRVEEAAETAVAAPTRLHSGAYPSTGLEVVESSTQHYFYRLTLHLDVCTQAIPQQVGVMLCRSVRPHAIISYQIIF
jgi:hypothetical protein